MSSLNTRWLSYAVLAGAISLTMGATPQEQTAASRHIVLISLDGFRRGRSMIRILPMPTLRALAGRGAIAAGMRPVNPTVTWPNHTTFVTGVTPAKHGVLFNGILKRDPGVPPRIEPWLPHDEMVRVEDAIRRRSRARYDDGAGRLGGDPDGADGHVGVSRAPGPDRRRSRRSWSRPACCRKRSSRPSHTRNIVWRDHVWTRPPRTSSASTGRT